MKKLLTLFAMLTIFVSMMAQVPFNYQAVLRDTTGGKNELVRYQSGTVNITVLGPIDNVTLGVVSEIPFTTNGDGMTNVTVQFAENIDWRGATIQAKFTYGQKTITLLTPVTPVPYAVHAEKVMLTTDDIEDYIRRSNGDDVDSVYQALKQNSEVHDAIRDTVVNYIKANFDIAKEIAYYYLSLVTAEDLNQAYAEARGLDQEVKDSIYSAAKRFLKENRDMAKELAKYFAESATSEEVQQMYDELLSNTSAKQAVQSLLNTYFDGYLARRGFNCPEFNFCDIESVTGGCNNSSDQPTTTSCPEVTSGLTNSGEINLSYDGIDFTATITYTGGSNVQVEGTYGTTNTPMGDYMSVSNNAINIKIPLTQAEVGEAQYMIVKVTISDPNCDQIIELNGSLYLN